VSDGPDGVLVVDKSRGPTSHDVVAVARRALATKRVGHTGTLDPMATGVVVLLAGRATRLARFMAHDLKAYEAEVTFGRTTDTYDAEGATTDETGRWPEAAALAESGLVPGSLLVTYGANGTAWNGRTWSAQIVPRHQVIDTTGAGDAFCGALAAALAEGVSEDDAMQVALAAGAGAVRHQGAQPDPAL
jgi:sugar/nucleoside kinase (ribokinase family)